jgi:uncharacterized membrane protein YhaH (DUF805 family)
MWLFYVVVWVIELALFLGTILTYAVLVATGVVGKDTLPERNSIYPGVAFTIVLVVFLVGIYYMYFAVTTKRLHDRDKSAWWILTFFVVPAFLIFTPEILITTKLITEDNRPAQIALMCSGLAGIGLTIWSFVELYCLRGTAGDNRFGPDPLAGRI